MKQDFKLSQVKMATIEQVKKYNECCDKCNETSSFRGIHCTKARAFYAKDYPWHLQPLAILKASREYNPFNYCPSFEAR